MTSLAHPMPVSGPLRAAVLALEHAAIVHGKVSIDRESAIAIVGKVIEAYIAALDQIDRAISDGGAR